MKKLILLLLISTSVYSQTDLRNNTLEIKLKSYVDRSNLITTHKVEDLEFCTRSGPLLIDSFIIKKAVYIFQKKQLNSIIISVDGRINCDGILNILNEIYGHPFKAPNREVFIWDNSYISCWYISGTISQNASSEIILSFKK